MHLDPQKYPLKTKYVDNTKYVFDPIRKKYLILTPEESVRQTLLNYLVHEHGYTLSHISIEKKILVNGLNKRYDLVVYKDNKPFILIECKAPKVKLTIETIEQACIYNFALKANYLLISNGIRNLLVEFNHDKEVYEYIEDLPNAN
tara:strand:+ start:567 stop:1004 length:438 start_codon:yes stop_codon:yes gene_type:complete